MRTMSGGEKFATVNLAGAAAMAIFALNHSAGEFEWDPLYLWVMAPYLMCAVAVMLSWGVARRRRMAGGATAFAMMVFTFLFYIEGLVRSTSSTSALILLFAPTYLIVGGGALWLLVYSVGYKLIDVPEESQ